MRNSLVLALLGISLFGCHDASEYSGDGELIDNGFGSATDRYVIKIDDIDLGTKGKEVYRIEGLPQEGFVIGFQITVAPNDRIVVEQQDIHPTVILELSHIDGETVFSKEGTLSKWTWSTARNESRAFVYGRGEVGTYFQSHEHAKYILTMNVLQGDTSQSRYTAVLMAKSGGWK